MSCALVCHECGHHQKSGTFDPNKRCEECDAPPQALGIEADESFESDNDEGK